ncbi:MAG: D-alanine--D-alanine ligase [Bacilli bacterium]|nr:D-alanine--D-alanine ligase [Bacilli bacterium]MDD4283097.1 D-alanine--D-alanine ligase [Bacilli bacterium]MDD4719159.1 D-alanine--D-alanine ligase [Bacilli bacterium]
MKIKVGVIFGGQTVEHEISIISAVQAMEYIDQEKYEIIPIYISKDRIWYTGKMLMDIDVYKDFDSLKKYAQKVAFYKKNGVFVLQTVGLLKRTVAELDIMFPIMHGNNTEDGSIQGYLETVGIPYVGSKVLGSAIGQDKVVMKQIMSSIDLPIVPYTWFYDTNYYGDKKLILKEIKKIGYPVIVKPATLGSSVGITLVKTEDKIDKAINDAIKYDVKIIVEKVIENLVEVNCSVLGNYTYQEASVIEEVISTEEFLTYTDKYIGKSKGKTTKGMVATNRVIPARINEKLYEEVQMLAKETFNIMNLSGVARIDFLIDSKKNKVYVNEPNTIPGSLSFYLWDKTNKPYTKLLDEMLSIAIKDFKTRSKKIYSFDTNILQNFNGLKGGKGIKGMKR